MLSHDGSSALFEIIKFLYSVALSSLACEIRSKSRDSLSRALDCRLSGHGSESAHRMATAAVSEKKISNSSQQDVILYNKHFPCRSSLSLSDTDSFMLITITQSLFHIALISHSFPARYIAQQLYGKSFVVAESFLRPDTRAREK